MPFDQQNFELPRVETDYTLSVLIKARALIQSGWAQCFLRSPDGRYCAQGALQAQGVYGGPIRELLIEALPASAIHPRHRNISLMLWNDKDSTTRADVLALFDRVIAARLESCNDRL